jgi:hypothetical protein
MPRLILADLKGKSPPVYFIARCSADFLSSLARSAENFGALPNINALYGTTDEEAEAQFDEEFNDINYDIKYVLFPRRFLNSRASLS